MKTPATNTFRCLCLAVAMLVLLITAALGQSGIAEGSASVEGTVCDANHQPLVEASVSLKNAESGKTIAAHTDSEGQYRFPGISGGTYTLTVKLADYKDGSEGPLSLAPSEKKVVVLLLQKADTAASSKSAGQTIEFSNETEFTVAGVTDPTNLGGHGSDAVLRTKEGLAKNTVALEQEDIERAKQRVLALRGHEDSAELHALLGEIAEHEGRPLEAVREDQRAAEMKPSEANLFAWGAELLLHRALEPAEEVFTKGHRQYPESVRMLAGLGVTSYARGAQEKAVKELLEACDMNPADPNPYLFLGKILEAEKIEPPGMVERLKRFSKLQPENAKASYYYALGLAKESLGAKNTELIESLLQKAIKIDAHFGDAYLQLGILYSEQKEYPKAISAYEQAIENTPFPGQAHFRLAQVYRQTGEQQKAHKEIELYNQISKQETSELERERHEIGQFVYTLRGQTTPAPASTAAPH